MKKILSFTILAITCTLHAQSPKGAESLKQSAPASHGHTVFASHVKQIGAIGNLQVHQIKIRGLDCPNLSAAVLFDPATGEATVIGPATGAGLAHSIVQAGANVGSAAVFGLHLRPAQNGAINNGASAVGGSATGTATATATATGGSGFIPPGQVNNPGNGH